MSTDMERGRPRPPPVLKFSQRLKGSSAATRARTPALHTWIDRAQSDRIENRRMIRPSFSHGGSWPLFS